MLRPATIRDVPRIGEIINSHAELGKMLFKSYAQLYEDLRDFCVLEKDGQVVGTVALSIIWADLAEVRSRLGGPGASARAAAAVLAACQGASAP